jgi:AcrR family transcriptional regulator
MCVMTARAYNARCVTARQDPPPHTRTAQRRRTRKAIVDAAALLIASGAAPSVADIATAADVSRRTVYLYFPTLEQLLLDATLGLVTQSAVDAALEPAGDQAGDVDAVLGRAIRTLGELIAETLPLGRSLIRLTVDRPGESDAAASADMPRRGYRRVEWIERVIAPLRERLPAQDFERLVSALAMVIGWEAFIVLADVRGLSRAQQIEVATWSAQALVRATLSAVGDEPTG